MKIHEYTFFIGISLLAVFVIVMAWSTYVPVPAKPLAAISGKPALTDADREREAHLVIQAEEKR